MKKTAVVFGANGQDGSFLCETLLRRGRAVIGLGRQPAFRYDNPGKDFHYVALDLTDYDRLAAYLDETAPHEIYHVAAIHGSAGFAYEDVWHQAVDVNLKALHAALQCAARGAPGERRVFYASSAKVFGSPLPATVSIETPRTSQCLYSITKNAGIDLIRHYRKTAGVFAAIGHLFNHESVRRDPNFFIPIMAGHVASARVDPEYRGEIGTLDFYCDWSAAREFMEDAVDLLELDEGVDVVLASGRTWHGREFARELFAAYGLNFENHLTPRQTRDDVPSFRVDIAPTIALLGDRPRRSIIDICGDIVAARAS